VFVTDTAKVTGVPVTVEPFAGVTSETETEPVAPVLLREFDSMRGIIHNTNTAEIAALLGFNRSQTKGGIWPFLLSFVTVNQSGWLFRQLQFSSKAKSFDSFLN
jgi:hypothetical protein